MKKGIGVFFDKSKSTSGQRFFGNLYATLHNDLIPLKKSPKVVLFNISVPLSKVLSAKLKGQTVVLRVDSLYFDRLSTNFIRRFIWPFRLILKAGLKYRSLHDPMAYLANFLNQNYTAFIRIWLADYIVYQSEFSQAIHKKFFPKKKSSIIVNGATYSGVYTNKHTVNKRIQLVTIHDDWRPSKRIQDIVRFVVWANEEKNLPMDLTIIGYNGKMPDQTSASVMDSINNSDYIKTLPRFNSFTSSVEDVLKKADLYLTFSYRDACPNAVIEAMSYGIPVVGVASGGLNDIVGNSGVLLPVNDFEDGFYAAHRYENDFPVINYDRLIAAIDNVVENNARFRQYVQERFEQDLDIHVVAERYRAVLLSLL